MGSSRDGARGTESPKRSPSLSTRLFIAYSLLALVLVILLSAGSVISSYAIVRQRAIGQLGSVAALRASEIGLWANRLGAELANLPGPRAERDLLLPLLGPAGAPTAGKEVELLLQLESMRKRDGLFASLSLLDLRGKVRLSTDLELRGLDLSSAGYFRRALGGELVSRFPGGRNEPLIVAARPILGPAGEALGVLVGYADPRALDSILSEPMGLGASGRSYLAGPDGLVLTGPERGGFLGRARELGAALASGLPGGGQARDPRGQAVLEFHLPVPLLGAVLVVQEDLREIGASIEPVLAVDLAAALLALLCAFLVSRALARSITGPLRSLAAAAADVAGGDFDRRAPFPRMDEIGAVAASFNEMAGRLRELVGRLRAELAERRRADEALRKEHERALQYFENAAVLMIVLDREARIVQLNRRGHAILGYEEGELVGRDWFELCLPPSEKAEVREVFLGLFDLGREDLEIHENRILTKGGRELILRWHNSFVRDRGGKIVGILSSGEDVTEQHLAEAANRRALSEKEALLRELHHRTKNNMGVIIGLLDLQASETKGGPLREAFTEIQDRIRSMALVHEKLYESGDLSRIDLSSYIGDLARLLVASYRASAPRVRLSIEAEEVTVLIDTAIPFGLFVNELLSNALKHGFPEGREGLVALELRREGEELVLEVRDDGVGAPPGFDPRRDGHMGLQTVLALGEEQLRGRVEFLGGPGFGCRLRFREAAKGPRV